VIRLTTPTRCVALTCSRPEGFGLNPDHPRTSPIYDSDVSIQVEEWDPTLRRLREDGFSPIESIKVTRAVLRLSLGEAKRIVHQSTAWEDAREGFDQLHDVAEAAVADL
jgi:hypothetical protein